MTTETSSPNSPEPAGAVNRRLPELGIVLPEAPAPAGHYRPFQLVEGWLYTSGQLSWRDGGIAFPGLLGESVSIEEGREAATCATHNLLAQLQRACDGDLDRIRRCVRITCFVACTSRFHDHPRVIDPVSEILCAVFGGEIGPHARLAYGAPALPFNSPIEIEGIFRLAD